MRSFICGAVVWLCVFYYFDTFATRLRSTPAYETAGEYIASSEQLHDRLGKPTRMRRYALGSIDDRGGHADFRIQLAGAHARGRVQLELQRITETEWRVVQARLTRDRMTEALAVADTTDTTDTRQQERAAARVARAYVLHQRGHVQESLEELRLAEAEDPRNAELFWSRARVHHDLGDDAAAIGDLRTACSLGHQQACAARAFRR